MDRLQAMEVFIRVVDTNSFTKAAHTLNLPRASVTNIIQNLEAYLKVRLLQRTTRRLNLTADGASYYARCVRVLAEIDEIEGAFSATKIVPRGKLRIETSGQVGKLILVPALDDFHARYPDIELTIGMSDGRHAGLSAAPRRAGQPAGARRTRRRQIHFGAHLAPDGAALSRRRQGSRGQAARLVHGQRRRGAPGDGPEGTGPVPDRPHAGAAVSGIGRAGGGAAAVEAGEDGSLAGLPAGPPPVAGPARLHPVDHGLVRGASAAGRAVRISAAYANSVCHFSCCTSARVFTSTITPPGVRQKKREPRVLLNTAVSICTPLSRNSWYSV